MKRTPPIEKCTDPALIHGPDTEEGVVRPTKRKSDPDAGPEGILVIIPSDLEYLLELTQSLPRSTHDMGYFKFHRLERKNAESFSISGPFLGAPHAVMGMEKLIALGVRRVLVLGWCGSLQPDIKTGDLVIPTEALSEEGTSRHYPIGERKARTSAALTARLEHAARDSGRAYRKGSVWTTDAPYREIPSKILKYRAMGSMQLNMRITRINTMG
jgi:uridine phosphorylase